MTEDRLIAVVEAQERAIIALGEQVKVLTENVALMVQALALAMGEELGRPVDEDDQEGRVDMDGNPY